MPEECLVILEPGGDIYDVTAITEPLQQIGSRVVVIANTRAEEVQKIPGVRIVATGPIDPALYKDLSEAEQLFVSAWSSRQGQKKTNRPGDGLDWDAPGYKAP